MSNIYNFWIVLIACIQHLNRFACALPRDPILWLLHLVEQRLENQVLGLLAVRAILAIDEAVLKQENEGIDAFFAQLLVRLIEKHLDDCGDNLFDGLGH